MPSKKFKTNKDKTNIKEAKKSQHRQKPGARALYEIRHAQKSVKQLLKFAPMSRIVREAMETICHKHNYVTVNRCTPNAIRAIMEATQAYSVGSFEDANRCTKHASRMTLQVRDIELVDALTKEKSSLMF